MLQIDSLSLWNRKNGLGLGDKGACACARSCRGTCPFKFLGALSESLALVSWHTSSSPFGSKVVLLGTLCHRDIDLFEHS
jgi:hypothetical protein